MIETEEEFNVKLLESFMNCDLALLQQCMSSNFWNAFIPALRTHNNYKYLGLSLVNCGSSFDRIQFIKQVIKNITWPTTYIEHLRYMFYEIRTNEEYLKTMLISQFMGSLAEPETLRFDKLEVVLLLVENEYKPAPLELGTLVLHDIDEYVFDQILAVFTPDYSDQESEQLMSYLVSRFSELLNTNQISLETVKTRFVRLLEHQLVFDLTSSLTYCSNLALRTWLIDEYQEILDGDENDEDELEMKMECGKN
jgi:hypothetical protein